MESREISLSLSSFDCDSELKLGKVYTVEKLPCISSTALNPKDLKKWPHLRDVEVPEQSSDQISLLIGADYPDAFKVKEVREGKSSGDPYAVRYTLGWTINGPLSSRNTQQFSSHFIVANTEALEEQMSRLWTTDFNDLPSCRPAMSLEDEKAKRIMMKTAYLDEDGHWTMRLPWKEDPPPLENNRVLAENRLKCLKRKFQNSPSYKEEYVKKMNTYIDSGFAVKVDVADEAESNIPKNYLPHHGVLHPQKKKLRVVFDCSAKYKGLSLNDVLLQGPDYLNSLVGVLLRFRQGKVAIASDVEAMFHQVRVEGCDQNALRFLWFQNGDMSKPVTEYKMTVHLFGAKSSPSVCCHALRLTAESQKDSCSPATYNAIQQNFYMDDLLKSVDCVDEASQLVKELTSTLQRGGFHLTKWTSSVPQILYDIPQDERSDGMKELDCEHLPVERALGLIWDVKGDSFHFRIQTKDRPMTRRGLLSETASLYDPRGFAAPVLLKAKGILQLLSIRKCGWDDCLPSDIENEWLIWK